jgi:hypothetical protein
MCAPLIGTGPAQGQQAPCTDDALQWTAAPQAFFASGVSGAYLRAIRVVLWADYLDTGSGIRLRAIETASVSCAFRSFH